MTREEIKNGWMNCPEVYRDSRPGSQMSSYADHLNLRTERANGTMSRPFLPVAKWRSTNMAEWIEVPNHRIYVISAHELQAGFDYLGESGRPATRGEIPYRFVRKKDGKVFKWARFAPQCSGVHDYTALEEI
jgi:hypothetical protein